MKFVKLKGQEKEIVDEFYRWATGICKHNFSALLFQLMCKADSGNQYRLKQGFPLEMELIQSYRNIEGWYEEFLVKYKEERQNGQPKNT